MAKQKGILPLTGTILGVNFYYLNGKAVARKAGGGFNGESIKTKASMKRVRENGSEFGRCSQVNKVFRQALKPFYKAYTFTFFHSRLMGLFTGLKALDTTSVRGERQVNLGVATTAGVKQLCDFVYTPDCQLKQVLPFTFNMDWDTYAFTISHFKGSQVYFSPGATHIALQFGILDFNFETLEHSLYMADAVLLPKDCKETEVSMLPKAVPNGTGTRLAVCGVRYYQAVSGDMHVLNSKESVGFGVVGVMP